MGLHLLYRWRSVQALFSIKMPYGFNCNFTWARNKSTGLNVPIVTKRTNVEQRYVRTFCADCHQMFSTVTCGHFVRTAAKCSAALRADILCGLPPNVQQCYVRTFCVDCRQMFSSVTCGHFVWTAAKCSAALRADILCGLPPNVQHRYVRTFCADCRQMFSSVTCGHFVRTATKSDNRCGLSGQKFV